MRFLSPTGEIKKLVSFVFCFVFWYVCVLLFLNLESLFSYCLAHRCHLIFFSLYYPFPSSTPLHFQPLVQGRIFLVAAGAFRKVMFSLHSHARYAGMGGQGMTWGRSEGRLRAAERCLHHPCCTSVPLSPTDLTAFW